MIDLRTDYDANVRAHQLVRDLYRETTGIDLVTDVRGPPDLHDLPAQTSGWASAPNAGAESSAGKKEAKKSRGRKLAAQEDEDEAEPDVDDDVEGAGHSEVDEDLDQDRGEETSDDEDDLPIIMTRSQSRASTSKSKPRPRPTTTKATIATSGRRQHLAIGGYTVSHGARNAHTTRQAVARTQPLTPLHPTEVEDPSSSSPLSEPPTSLVSAPHTLRRSGRVRNNVDRELVATSHADSDADGDEEMGDAASVPAPVSTSRHPAPQQRQEEHTQTFVRVDRPPSVGFAANRAPPHRHPTTGPNTGVIAAGAAMFTGPRPFPSANQTPTPMPTTSTSTPTPSGIPIRLTLALNHPSTPLSAPLTTSLSTISAFPQLIAVKSASFRREFSSPGGMGSVVVKGCFATVDEGEGARWVDVGAEDRYLEWVGAVGEVGRLQGQGVGLGMGGMVVFVVERKEGEGAKGREKGHGTGLGGGSGAGNGGNGGSGGDGLDEEGMGEYEMPLSRPTKPSSPHHGSSKSSKTPSSRGSMKTRTHATMEAYSPSNAVSHESMAGTSSSATPSQQSQHISSVVNAAQQTRQSHSQGRPAFAFTESEEETDEEEMVEVPLAYFERLELGQSKRNGSSAQKGEDPDDERDADRRFWEPEA